MNLSFPEFFNHFFTQSPKLLNRLFQGLNPKAVMHNWFSITKIHQ